jgi:RND superfamily putative drug exporter
MFASLARACLRHRWIVIGAWVGLLVVINGIASSAGADWKTDFVLPDSESKDVQELLEANDPNRAGFTGQIVVKADQGITDPDVESAFTEIVDFAAEQPGVTVTSPYDNAEQISESGEIAYAQLDISDRGFEEITQLGTDIEEFADSQPAVQGMQVEYGGDPFSEFELPES